MATAEIPSIDIEMENPDKSDDNPTDKQEIKDATDKNEIKDAENSKPSDKNGKNGDGEKKKKTGTDTKPTYKKDCTIRIIVGDNRKVKAKEIVDKVDEQCQSLGGCVLACVPVSGDGYDVTVNCRDVAEIVVLGIKEVAPNYSPRMIHSDTVVVSFMHLPSYIEDVEIIKKLENLSVTVMSPVKRRFYKGTQIADGTRFVRVSFPDNIKSLPYSMRFETADGAQYFRVIHDDQVKVCSKCMSDQHLIKECPKMACFKCKQNGHKAKFCKVKLSEPKLCDICNYPQEYCDCPDIQEVNEEIAKRSLTEHLNYADGTLCEKCGTVKNDEGLCTCFVTIWGDTLKERGVDISHITQTVGKKIETDSDKFHEAEETVSGNDESGEKNSKDSTLVETQTIADVHVDSSEPVAPVTQGNAAEDVKDVVGRKTRKRGTSPSRGSLRSVSRGSARKSKKSESEKLTQ